MKSFSNTVFKRDEQALFALRELYSQYGYARYKVSKFEEYDFYARNKSFLVSERILTFTDTNGRLMALKPDVTLSIIKNVKNDDLSLRKLYYNENVYRPASGSDGFREILQTGLECIGNVDLYQVAEVLSLAKQSLSLIGEESVLVVSHMGLLEGLIESIGVSSDDARSLLAAVETKNTQAIGEFAADHGIAPEDAAALCRLTELYAPLEKGLEEIAPLVRGDLMRAAYDELCAVASLLGGDGEDCGLYLDFSIVNDMNYYNGIIFRGFVNGIPDGVLSGGRYDRLMEKMNKRAGAIGFALYLDLLTQLGGKCEMLDADVLLTYTDGCPAARVLAVVNEQRAQGARVLVLRDAAQGIRCRTRMQVSEEGVKILEAND